VRVRLFGREIDPLVLRWKNILARREIANDSRSQAGGVVEAIRITND
jgi:hypothetical protein